MGNEETAPQEEQQPTAGAAGKTFTQEEVNAIVQKRLERERSKQGADENSTAPITDKEQELNQRELNIRLKETLLAKGMPTDLADILRVSEDKDIDTVIGRLDEYASSVNKDKKNDENKDNKLTGFQLGAPGPGISEKDRVDPYRKVMGL